MWPPDGTSLSRFFFPKEFHAQTSVTAMSSGIRKRSKKHLFLSNVARQQRTLEISVSFRFPLLLKSLKLVCSQAPWSWFKNSKILTSRQHPLLTQAVLFHYCPFIWVLVGGTSMSSVMNPSHRCVHSLLGFQKSIQVGCLQKDIRDTLQKAAPCLVSITVVLNL